MNDRLPTRLAVPFAIALRLVLCGPSSSEAGEPPNGRSPLGANLSFLADYTGEQPFVDPFKTSRPWISGERFGCFGCGPPLALDENGWVTVLDPTTPNGGQVARTILYDTPSGGSRPPGYLPLGTYVLTYDGEGQLLYQGSWVLDAGASVPGRHVLEVDSDEGLLILNLIGTNPANPLRNIRIAPPGGVCEGDRFRACASGADCAADAPCRLFADTPPADRPRFHPSFLARLRSARVLRLLDWMRTNDNLPAVDVGDWLTVDDARWWVAPVEVMAELANHLGADLWVTLPHGATNAFVDDFAARLVADLAPWSKVYVEYSNEVWNTIFPQHLWIARRGCEAYPVLQAGCAADAAPGNGVYCDGHPWPSWNESCAAGERRYYSRRAAEVWQRFDSAFGDPARVVHVLASQVGNVWLHQQLLDWEGTAAATDLLAVGPYFGGAYGADADVTTWTPAELLADLATNPTRGLPATLGWVEDDGALVKQYPGLRLAAYEGGQHLAGLFGNEQSAAMNALFDAVNRDPAMGALYTDLLDGWRARGGTLFAHYVQIGHWSRYGRWGALEFRDQPPAASPKYSALQEFVADNPCWWEGCAAALLFADGVESGDTSAWDGALFAGAR